LKILSIDTASNICGVSILENTKLILNLDSNTGRTHSENLMPMIQEIFNKTSLTLKDIDLIVCDKGPGSFTGIRIGIATTKGFCDSLNIPSIGVSSLEALAYNVKDKKLICSMINCNNGNCYFALYENNKNTIIELIEPQTETIESALSILKSYCEDTLNTNLITFVGDGSEIYINIIKEFFPNANFANKELNILNSYNLGTAGFNKYLSNTETQEVLPLYLKKPQAQRQLEEKLK